jgi:pimeloyl-ACP methyl ester carboxylesterase
MRPDLVLPSLADPPPPGSRAVRTDDGVDLHVEVDENPDARLTVVLAHGFTARLAEWELQREELRPRARLVLFDQRGHGRSGWTKLTQATIDRTGRDLGEVLDATTPEGPVVLAGHSMGGMSVMALARQRPELFGTRVVGVFLLATSAGGLVESGLVGRAVNPCARTTVSRASGYSSTSTCRSTPSSVRTVREPGGGGSARLGRTRSGRMVPVLPRPTSA